MQLPTSERLGSDAEHASTTEQSHKSDQIRTKQEETNAIA